MNLFSSLSTFPQQDLNDAEKLNWLRLIRTDNVGPITFYKLIECYGSASQALEALPELSRKGGRKKELIAPPISKIEAELDSLRKLGGDIVCAADPLYPLALGATEDAPPVLSYIGDIKLTRPPCLAMVGARNASLNGRKFAHKLSGELGQSGQIIVSGLARGIDTAAHEGALNTGTIAVVAGGIDVVYPRDNQKLYEQICHQGLVLAESPFGTQPVARHFPKRNRIVSGISSGVLVVEATLRSGSLITARMAGEQGRDVSAIPGYPGDPRAHGPNKLIQDGATLVQSADDILSALQNFSGGNSMQDSHAVQTDSPYVPANDEPLENTENTQDIILQNLSQLPVSIDELVNACHLTIPEVQMCVLELELAGRLQRLPGNRVALLDKE
ncbi:MAG: DNA-protecting protein DprA [Alphaproteobacteria bacterium]|nr:DNA-protecting protein DprA [Alphaproteobacteria bacterium]